ncbi:MAG: sugar phosphate nucleotidyltransferase [Verrucomicrobiota bacterium]|nr:sugar phosphate nucleotidyltransferase [Verrucomicrobiota bacterium]
MPSITQAFVLGAGLGLRLRPLTDDLPKPLVPIFQKPLITFALDHLLGSGIESFAINTHRIAENFEKAFAEGNYRGAPVTLLHEPVLLETGGGIKNAERALRPEPFIVYSGDILTDIELAPLIDEHLAQRNDVTLALRETGLARGVAFRDGRVVDIGGKFGHAGTHDFANISIWNPEIFSRIPPHEKISFIPILNSWISQGGQIGGVILNERKWFNIGSRAGYLEVHRTIAQDGWRPQNVSPNEWPQQVAPEAIVDPSAQLRGFNSLGAGCRVEVDAVLENTIVWPGAQIASRSELRNCIVRANQKAEGKLSDTDI